MALILGTNRPDCLYGEHDEANLIFGRGGNDILKGGNLYDYIDGGLGDDKIWGMDGNDTLLGNFGNDSIWGGNGRDCIFGGPGKDYLNGESGNDFLDGGIGNDILEGCYGNDTLLGGLGDDFLNGGPDSDIYLGYCNPFFGNDVIFDPYAKNDNDVICLYCYDTDDLKWKAIDTDHNNKIDSLEIIYNRFDSITVIDYFDDASKCVEHAEAGCGSIHTIITGDEYLHFDDVQALCAA